MTYATGMWGMYLPLAELKLVLGLVPVFFWLDPVILLSLPL